MSEPLRVAVVGLGIGQAHLLGYLARKDLFRITVLCDADPSRAGPWIEGLRGVRAVTEIAEVAGADDVDVVSVCTPPHLHAAHCRTLLEAGKHVICEKPLTGSLRAVDELAAVEAAAPGRLVPVYQYRFGRGLQKLKALVDAGVAGRGLTASVEVAWRRGPDYYAVPWRGRFDTELGGILLSHSVHGLDMVTYALGRRPVRAFARTATRVNEIETEDCATASIELDDGTMVSLAATLGSCGDELSRHRFHLQHLTAESNTAPYDNSSEPWTFAAATPEHQAAVDEVLGACPEEAEGYQRLFELAAAALRDPGQPLPVTVADARAGIELVSALYWSARTGTDVELPLATDHPAYGGWR